MFQRPVDWMEAIPDGHMGVTTVRDDDRRAALHRLNLLNGASEEAFDRFTRLAVRLLDVPAAFISLVGDDVDVFVSQCGFERATARTERQANTTLCRRVTEAGGPLVMDDTHASSDDFDTLPAVGALDVAAFVGIPLRLSTGVAIGSLCAIDTAPRHWSESQVAILSDLAVAIVTEIEVLQAAAVAALKERRRFRDLVDGLEAIVWEMDLATWTFTFVSQYAETLLGYPLQEWLVPGFWQTRVLHPDDRAWAVDFCASAAEEGRDHDFEYRAIAADGSIHWLHDRVGIIRDDEARPHLMRGVMIDVTQRRETEEALRRSETELAAAEAHYRRLVENAPYAIYTLDRGGHFTEVNETAARLLGRTPEELIGRNIAEVIVPEDLPHALETVRRRLAGEQETSDTIVRLMSKNGETRQMHIRATVIREGGEITGTHGIARDITDEVAREQHLRRAERLASLGTLIGGVAHELNNPLHAIRSFAELMLQDERNAEDREGLSVIHREALRASRVVADFRLIARETQDAVSERQPVDVNDIVRHVIKLRRYALDTSNIVLRVDLARDLAPVMADRAQLEQVLLNLVINAEQAMQPQPVKRLVLRTRSTGDGASIHVVDSGTGIPRAQLHRIFDPFYTTKAPGEGTGLGLALAHSIITEHEGEIHVDSEPEQGTAFRIDLPCCPPAMPAQTGRQSRAERPVAVPGLRILVVDDEPSIRQVFDRYLTRRGHTVVTASDGNQALQLIHEAGPGNDFDVILSDLRMPGLSGEQLLDRLRSERPDIEERLVFLTGDAAGSDAARILASTDVPVLYKPIDLEAVAMQIEKERAPR